MIERVFSKLSCIYNNFGVNTTKETQATLNEYRTYQFLFAFI